MKGVVDMSEKQIYWWKCAGIRAIKTVAQTAVATIGSAVVMSGVDWKMVLSASVLAGILSLLTSIAGIPEVDQAEYLEDAKNAEFYEDDNDEDLEEIEDEDISEGNQAD